jgi:alpha-L-fucosidase
MPTPDVRVEPAVRCSLTRPLAGALAVSIALALAGVAAAQPAGPARTPAPAAAAADPGNHHDGQALRGLESPAAAARRLGWWREARFGMFIHWGLYSQDGCFWKGQDGKTEHMMRHLRIPLTEYAKIAEGFNPVKFDADAWVRTAKGAGMKYLVITSKHHDGFAMFGSKASDYNIVARTPFRRDPLAELAAACRRHGLKLGVYYSLGRDWQDPDVPTRDGWRSNSWDYPDESKKDFSRYFERKVKPQVRELLTRYGPIGIVWFDTPEKISAAQSEELLRMIRGLQPAALVNARVGNRLGDYAVQEQKVPESGQPQPWETCMTLNRHWGWHKMDQDWKSPQLLVRTLIDVASKGGNFLLNVGPTGAGEIPAPSVERLAEVGRWMKTNGAAIHGSAPCSLEQPAWGRCTARGGQLFLHVFDWPAGGRLELPALPAGTKVVSARLLAGGARLAVEQTAGKVAVVTPSARGPHAGLPAWGAAAPDPLSSTIVLQVRGNR